MALKVYNTLTRKLEPFEPLAEGRVNMYVCGPTVWDRTHLGHARTYVAFDIIIRWLEHRGFKVFYVQNITDVGHLTEETAEDKVVKGAREKGMQPMALVETCMREYFHDMDLLGVRRPDISPRATGHLIEMVEAIERLIAKGYAYEVGGDVFFDVSKLRRYGKLSRFNREQMLAGSRFEVSRKKRAPEDFALWKKARRGNPLRWKSPWGYGFPGWHIECSVMSMKYLGPRLDIHGGGQDLVFPHHENEIAQSEALTGRRPFVKYWLHTGPLTINGQKMAKSLGNYISVKDALKTHSPEALRLFIASAHYRSEIDYSERRVAEAQASLERLYTTIRSLEDAAKTAGEMTSGADDEQLTTLLQDGKKAFEDAMDEDFNTPKAIAALFELSRGVNRLLAERKQLGSNVLREAGETFRRLGSMLGILERERLEPKAAEERLVGELVDLLMEARDEARRRSDWKLADRIRDKLSSLGIQVEDQPGGSVWRRL
ncbi:MAG: cysteine--tRNA ligase [Candidatus Bathyarchaeia archaeon]